MYAACVHESQTKTFYLCGLFCAGVDASQEEQQMSSGELTTKWLKLFFPCVWDPVYQSIHSRSYNRKDSSANAWVIMSFWMFLLKLVCPYGRD